VACLAVEDRAALGVEGDGARCTVRSASCASSARFDDLEHARRPGQASERRGEQGRENQDPRSEIAARHFASASTRAESACRETGPAGDILAREPD